jgi:hypothetical protein
MQIAFCLRPSLSFNRHAVGPFTKIDVGGQVRFTYKGTIYPLNTAEDLAAANKHAFDLSHLPFIKNQGGFLPIILPDVPVLDGVMGGEATTITQALDLMAMLMTPQEREEFITATNARLATVRAEAADAMDAALEQAASVEEKDEASDNPLPPETVPVGDLPPPVEETEPEQEAETPAIVHPDVPEGAVVSTVEPVAEPEVPAPAADEPVSGDLPPPVEEPEAKPAKKAAKKK